MESVGLKNGSMVHALQKKEPESSILNKHVSEDCILQLASAFKSFNETPAFRSALHVNIVYIMFMLYDIYIYIYFYILHNT